MSNNLHPGIIVRSENERGCGRRSVGRMYLVSDGRARNCGKMPVPLEVCPCCGQGIKPSRAPQWLEQPERLWSNLDCTDGGCSTCPLSNAYETGPALLVWVGEKYYKTPQDFRHESKYMGISRFIRHIPRNFVLGETWVFLAHRKTIKLQSVFDEPTYQPGIFSVFKPSRIEIIVDGTESHDKIDSYLKRGLTPVLIEKAKKAKSSAGNQEALL